RRARTSLRRRRNARRNAYRADRASSNTPETSDPVSRSARDLRVGWWRLNMTFEGSSYVSTTGALSMPVDRWDAVLPEEMLTRLTGQHPTILLVGPATFTEAALRLIEPLVQHPIAWWAPAQKRSVPTGGFATLFIGGVDAADAEQQSRLCNWLDAYPG